MTYDSLFYLFLEQSNILKTASRHSIETVKCAFLNAQFLEKLDIFNLAFTWSYTHEGRDYWREKCLLWMIFQIFYYVKCEDLFKKDCIEDLKRYYKYYSHCDDDLTDAISKLDKCFNLYVDKM